jgi:prophage antirepressor-like protein
MNSLTNFEFNGNAIRVIMLNGEPWFVAKDVAQILEHTNVTMMINPVDEDDKQVINPHKIDTKDSLVSFDHNTFKVSIINESGLYAVIFNSNKPEAKTFKRWVTSKVLPSIRKTGQYQIRPMSPAEILMQQAQLMLKLEQEQELLKQQMALESQRVDDIQELVEQHDNELDRIFKPDGDYYTVRGYANKIGIKHLTISEANRLGRKASKYCKQEGIPMDKMDDPRYGYVKCYPERVLGMIFE